MDPDATLAQLLEALEEQDRDRVLELSDALGRWIRGGGFPPKTLGAKSLGTEWHAAITSVVLMLARGRLKISES